MKIPYTILHNVGDGAFRKYGETDLLVRGWSGEVDARELAGRMDPHEVLESVFARHNRDDRPDGKLAPSLSCGDVVLLGETAWAVESIGFEKVPTPVEIDLRPYLEVRAEQRVAGR